MQFWDKEQKNGITYDDVTDDDYDDGKRLTERLIKREMHRLTY
jgi:hypothetical protein